MEHQIVYVCSQSYKLIDYYDHPMRLLQHTAFYPSNKIPTTAEVHNAPVCIVECHGPQNQMFYIKKNRAIT